jgi:hypothetical protein
MPTRFLRLTAVLTTVAAALGAVAMRPALAATKPAAPRTIEGVPAIKHAFVIVLENESFDTSFGPGSPAVYLNSLLSQGAFADNYYGVSHLSAGNYIAMTSGQPPTLPFQSDCPSWGLCEASEKARLDGGRNVADQIEERHLTWAGYMDSMPGPCAHGPQVGPDTYQGGAGAANRYATRHNPFVYYPSIVENDARCSSHVVPYTNLVSALQTGAPVPNLSFISPDTCHDGHDGDALADGTRCDLAGADQWLSQNVRLILNSAAYQDGGALFITFDEAENNDNSGCCATGETSDGNTGGGRIGLVMLSPMGKVGHASDLYYDHNSLLRTLEDGFGITEHLNNAASPKVKPLTELFAH